ncbi:MAG: hypothetical protein V4649_16795 [Bacteroidota bacterium]
MKPFSKAHLQAIAFFVFVGLPGTCLTSCNKSENNDAAKFVGTWAGTSSCSPAGGAVTFVAGANGSTFNYPAAVIGSGSCMKQVTVVVTASGNNCTISPQTFVDLCGVSYTVSGAGSISGNTLYLTLQVTGASTLACAFTGTK